VGRTDAGQPHVQQSKPYSQGAGWGRIHGLFCALGRGESSQETWGDNSTDFSKREEEAIDGMASWTGGSPGKWEKWLMDSRVSSEWEDSDQAPARVGCRSVFAGSWSEPWK
jgi:hypothetical protein